MVCNLHFPTLKYYLTQCAGVSSMPPHYKYIHTEFTMQCKYFVSLLQIVITNSNYEYYYNYYYKYLDYLLLS